MKKKATPTTKRKSLVQAIREVTGKTKRIDTKRHSIIEACGKDLHLLIEMMCDNSVSGKYIHRVLTEMGSNISYPYVQQSLRPWFQENYGWYRDMVEKADDAPLDEPRPLVHRIPRSAFTGLERVTPAPDNS